MLGPPTTASARSFGPPGTAARETRQADPSAGLGQCYLDRAGICVGLFCAGHCTLAACAPVLLPFLARHTDPGSTFEWLVVVSSCALAGLAAAVGFRRHGRWWIPALFILSVGLLLASRCLEHLYALSSGAALVALLGGLGVAAGHLANRRCSRVLQPCRASVTCAEVGTIRRAERGAFAGADVRRYQPRPRFWR